MIPHCLIMDFLEFRRARTLAPLAQDFSAAHFVSMGRVLVPPLTATVAGQINAHQKIAALTSFTSCQVLDVVGE
jgi:hypothetical protein